MNVNNYVIIYLSNLSGLLVMKNEKSSVWSDVRTQTLERIGENT